MSDWWLFVAGFADASALKSDGKSGDFMEVWDLIRPERKSLCRLRRVSLRNRSWFTDLGWEQRRLIEAAIMVVEKIRSLLLLRLLAPLVMKLLDAAGKGDALRGAFALMGAAAYGMMRDVALRISRVALGWGNKFAHRWREDVGFVRFLTVMSLPENRNQPLFTIPELRIGN